MCGIAGIVNLKPNRPVETTSLLTMLGALRHRGPDEVGIYTCEGGPHSAGLGCTRLSIIDLEGGHQPIGSESGDVWVVCNGEIFNYLELRALLRDRGHDLTTSSDTEVLLHLYEDHGPACLEFLNGQFAFAIWDERRRSLLLARDRLGIRPLFYTIRDGVLLFASEIKALLTDQRVPAAIDPVALDQLFTYWSPLAPRTAFQGIYSLPPGHFLRVAPNGEYEVTCYWRLTFPEPGEPVEVISLDEAAGQLRERLLKAVRLRLRADVPVGAYLSGGLDSSSIAALVRQHAGNRLETFSIAFADAGFDESGYQREVAGHLGTRHHLIRCDYRDVADSFSDVVWHAETPIVRTAPGPMYLLSRLVNRQGFKVVLTGEGADEFLGGYNIFKEAKIRRFWARQPASTTRPALLGRLYPYVDGLARGDGAYLRRFFGQGLTEIEQPDYSHAIRWRNTARSKRVFSRELRSLLADRASVRPVDEIDLPPGFQLWGPLAQAQFLECAVFLPGYLLSSQGDRMAMAHSVEGRFPFLDHELVAFCNQLPERFKLRGLDEKHVLKRAMRDVLPEAVLRRPKRPYRAPIHRSFFPDGPAVDWVSELLSPAQLLKVGCFDPETIGHLVQKLQRLGRLGETDDMALAGVLSTQLLYDRFLCQFSPSPPVRAEDLAVKIARNVGTPAIA